MEDSINAESKITGASPTLFCKNLPYLELGAALPNL